MSAHYKRGEIKDILNPLVTESSESTNPQKPVDEGFHSETEKLATRVELQCGQGQNGWNRSRESSQLAVCQRHSCCRPSWCFDKTEAWKIRVTNVELDAENNDMKLEWFESS